MVLNNSSNLDTNQYISIFIEEARENLQSMNEILLELERNPSHLGNINDIFRIAHTFKGMSGTMGFHNMANLTHEMENVLQSARSKELPITEELIDILFECFDAIDSSVVSVMETYNETSDDNQELIRKLSLLLQENTNGVNGNNNDNNKDNNKDNNNTCIDNTNIYISENIIIDKTTQDKINDAEVKNNRIYSIDIILTEKCMLKSARAFIIFNVLESHGEILHTNPNEEDIDNEKFERGFSVILSSKSEKTIVEKDINSICEVELVNIQDISKHQQNKLDECCGIYNNDNTDKDYNDNKENSNKFADNTEDTKNKPEKLSKTVRVDIDRLDNLMNLVSELIIIKTQMDDVTEVSNGEFIKVETLTEAIEYLERITTNLHDAVMKVRMVPIERVFNRFPRLVRDLSKELGKEIDLLMSGEDTEVDRTVIDEIGDPLIHLIRNSIDHGIEIPEDRLKAGKSRIGTVILKSYPDGNNVVIEVEDDGKGLDHFKIRKKAVEKGLITIQDAEKLSLENSVKLLFEAGFSTADTVSDVSGRGVGLDVVKSKIEAINGNIEVISEKDKGTKFIIRIPLTLAIIQALLVKLSAELYAIPLSSITEITEIKSTDIRKAQGQEIIIYREKTLPIIRLKSRLNIHDTKPQNDLVVVVVNKGDKQAGLIVDSLVGQQEIVIKGLGKYLRGTKYLTGATILGNGKVSLILDINSLI